MKLTMGSQGGTPTAYLVQLAARTAVLNYTEDDLLQQPWQSISG